MKLEYLCCAVALLSVDEKTQCGVEYDLFAPHLTQCGHRIVTQIAKNVLISIYHNGHGH